MKKAYTSLELLIALAIFSAVLYPSFNLIISSSAYFIKLKKQAESTKTLVKTNSLLKSVFKRLDSYPFQLPPVIHARGQIKFTDGSENPVVESNIRPNPNSDAITSISLNTNSIYRISEPITNSENLEFIACLNFQNNQHDLDAKTFIAISLDSLFELTGESKRILGVPNCRKFLLQKTKSMIVPIAEVTNLELIRILIPVSAYSTMYLDNSGKLRYLGHRGSTNIENQPLLENLEQLNLGLEYEHDLYKLSVESKSVFDKKLNFSFVNQISRISKFSYLNSLE